MRLVEHAQQLRKFAVNLTVLLREYNFPWVVKYTLSSLFAQKPRVNTERVPPGHPIILLKSIKFNMAAVSVKRSIMRINLLGTFEKSGEIRVR